MADLVHPADGTLLDLVARLVAIPRSLTGDGVRATLAALGAHVPMVVHEVPTGEPACDWTVPAEWNLEDHAARQAHGGELHRAQAAHDRHVGQRHAELGEVRAREWHAQAPGSSVARLTYVRELLRSGELAEDFDSSLVVCELCLSFFDGILVSL